MTTEVETEKLDENTEDAAFDGRVDSLVPEVADIIPEETPEAATAAEEAEEAAQKYFLGEWTEEQVLSRLQEIEGLDDRVTEKVSSKVFGKFGEVNQRLKELQEKEVVFDPEALTKLKEVDESLYDVLVESLPAAFKGRQLDTDAIQKDLKESILGDLVPVYEQRLMEALAPDAKDVVRTNEFADWYTKVATQDVRDMFEAWDAGTKFDGVGMAQAIKSFHEFESAKAADAKAKEEKLKMSQDESKKGTASSQTRPPLDEDAAFNARVTETFKPRL